MRRQLYAETGFAQIIKHGEELCGDKVVVTQTEDATILVLSDGLGSGVKANILATMTTKIASSMLRRGIALEAVVETIAETLPICRQRKVAYSTLQILKIYRDATAMAVEMDCPPTLVLSGGKAERFPTTERRIAGKKIAIGQSRLKEGDILAAFSDGVLHAGMGGRFPFGWGLSGVTAWLEAQSKDCPPQALAQIVLQKCREYYDGRTGDDSTAVFVRLHSARQISLMIGPPASRDDDRAWIEEFLSEAGRKAISGGTTANIVSAVTGKPISVDLVRREQNVPPIGHIEGIDLVTEGILTLSAVLERLEDDGKLADETKQDGATLLARLLLESDVVKIFAGRAVNSANRNPNNPFQIYKKTQILEKMQNLLEQRGKKVRVVWR